MRLTIVGCGYWGPNLLRTFNNLGVVDSVYDLDTDKIKSLSSNPAYKHIKFGTTWEECLLDNSITGVVIATPPNTHYSIAMAALNANKHVFIEKPMTLDVTEAEKIVAFAKEKNLIVMVGHIFLYSPEILKLKEIIMSEDFGDVQYIYTKRLNLGKIQMPANVVEDLAPHDISVLDFLLDKRCDEVQVVAKSHVLDTEDVAFINMKYGDTLCNLHLSWLDPLKVRDTVVVGTKQMVVCDSMNKQIHLYNKGVDLDKLEGAMDSYASSLLSYKYGDELIPYIDTNEPMNTECTDFLECISDTTKTPVSDGNVGLAVVNTLAAFRKSLDTGGKWVTV